jgi:hypothetical protein
MDCTAARHRLRTLASAEAAGASGWADCDAHLQGCAACRRVWRALDPVAATAAFGAPRAPAGFTTGVLTAVAKLSGAGEAEGTPPLGSVWAVAAAAAVVALWAASQAFGPLAIGLLATRLALLVADAAAASAALRAVLAMATPGPALGVTAGLVLVEFAVLHRWMRPSSR